MTRIPAGSPPSSATDWCGLAPSAGTHRVWAANRFGVDYSAEAARLGPPVVPIIDIHSHVAGEGAAKIFRNVATLFGIQRVYTMVPLPSAAKIRETLGDLVRFIAFTNFRSPDRNFAFRQGYCDDLKVFHREFGAKIVKFWNAPRFREIFPAADHPDLVEFDSPWRIKQAELASDLGMMFMAHVADPDTWFRTKYADSAIYKKKIEHYAPLERMTRRFPGPWILAHMGGYAEDLDFLDGLLDRNPNIYLDTSATKWVVRELSGHPAERTRAFFVRWRSRILFGSDIVTIDEHLASAKPLKEGERPHPMAELADSPESAHQLYSSRYYALRLLFESGYSGPSPIADPDMKMVDPAAYDEMSAPNLRGLSLPHEVLRDVYASNAQRLVESRQ